MVVTRFATLAVLSVFAASVSATYVAKATECYANGERAIGAPGKPAVPFYPCCSGELPRPKKQDYSYKAATDWGEFCGEEGNVVVNQSKCYEAGEKAIGAPGYPAVDYKPCCNKKSPREKRGSEIKKGADEWGMFCMGGAATAPEAVVETGKIRCSGAPGRPYVPYVFCGVNKKCAPSPSDGWGSFCLPKTAKDCVAAGDRNEGEAGYPNVPYLPCCSGKPNVAVKGQWGRFCPADGVPRTVVVVTAAPTAYKPAATQVPTRTVAATRAPSSATEPAYVTVAPTCVKAGFSCNPYGMKCCGANKCASSGYGPYRCVKEETVVPTNAPTTVAPTAPPTTVAITTAATFATETMPMESDEM